MEKEIIESVVASIPVTEFGTIQDDHEMWEETDGGAHFKVTRHVLPLNENHQVIALTVSGEPSERRRIIHDFNIVFGSPAGGLVLSQEPGHQDVVEWLV